MDSCLYVEQEVDKIITKLNSINDCASKALYDIIKHVKNLQHESESCSLNHELTSQQILILKQIIDLIKETAQYMTMEHRDLHTTISKVGKAIDRHFTQDFEACNQEEVFDGSQNEVLLNQIICQHFYQQGMLEIAEYFAEEFGLIIDTKKIEPLFEINKILDCLKKKDVAQAIQWANNHQDYLAAQKSDLEFKLHQLKFITLIQQGMLYQVEAVQYARTYLKKFAGTHEKEIQNLMGMFLYLPQGLLGSPYAHYLTPVLWFEISELFERDACNFLGLTINSPLSICINAGCDVLPTLLNIKHAMQQRQLTDIWNGKSELAIGTDLGPEYQYHNVFTCPILKQQSSSENPPVRLICGHVISRDALNKLSNNLNKLKCPYCSVKQDTSEAMKIQF